MDRSQMSLVDPAWEYLDPTPDIFAMFQEFDKTFFGGTMDRVELKWSKRMTSCAGLMAPLEGRGGACSIRLSEPLLKLRPRKDLVQTLLHEMIHAHLHVTRNRESDPHGPKFKEHMHRINKIAGTNITVYHNFHDEVNLHKQHWWRCNGPCRNWKPYYGWVKRATNRAPAKNDFWWAQHQQNCGGQYIKVKEPEGYSKKKEAQAQKSLGKNGNLLSKIKKKYNVNRPVSTVTTPKISDMWNKKPTNVTSPKTPLKTNNSSSPFQTKSPPFQTKNPPFQTKSPPFQTKSPPFQTKNPPFHTKGSSPNRENIKSPLNSFSNGGVTLGTNGNQYSMNNILGQLHKENMERRRHLSGKNDTSRIDHETKSKSQENPIKGKAIFVDLTDSPLSQPVSSKNKHNSSLILKKPTSSLIKQVIPDSEQKSLSKVPQSSLRDFGKPLKDRNLHESQRSFLTNKVGFVEKSVERSFKSSDKYSKSHLSSSSVSPEKKTSLDFNSTSVSSQQKKSLLNSSTSSSPKSNNDHSFLTKRDTETSLHLLKKKRKRLLNSSTDSSPNEQTSSKSEKKSWTISSNLSSRLNPDFFSTSSYKEKKPLFSDSTSSKEKKSSPNNSLSSNNSIEKTLLSSSDSFSTSNKERKPSINNSNTYSLFNERKLSMTNSSSSSSPNDKDRKHSPINSSLSTSVNKARKTIFTDTSPSHIPIKRHSFPDSSSSHSPFKQKKVSHTEPYSTSKHLSSSSPEKKHSSTKLYSSQYSDKHKRKEDLTFVASPADKICTSSLDQQTPEKLKKKSKLFEQLFGDDSDSEIETDKINSPRLKYPDSSSSSTAFTSRNATKSPRKSTSGSSSKKSTSQQIQSNRLENYFSSPIKGPSDDDVIVDNDMASSGRISQSQTSQTMVACPICQKKMSEIAINNHLDVCLNMNFLQEST